MSDEEEHPGIKALIQCNEQVTIIIRNYLGVITKFLWKNKIIHYKLYNEVNDPNIHDPPDTKAKLVYQRLQDMVQQDEKYYGIFVDYLRNKSEYGKIVSMLDKVYADNGGNVGSLPNPPGHQNEGEQTRRHSLQESGEGHSSIQRLPSHSSSEPPMKQSRMESLSSGISSDAENNFPQVHSSQKRPLHDVLEESSSKRLRIDSLKLSSGNASDVAVDLPQGSISKNIHQSFCLPESHQHSRIESHSSSDTSVVDLDFPQGDKSRKRLPSDSIPEPPLQRPRIESASTGDFSEVETYHPQSTSVRNITFPGLQFELKDKVDPAQLKHESNKMIKDFDKLCRCFSNYVTTSGIDLGPLKPVFKRYIKHGTIYEDDDNDLTFIDVKRMDTITQIMDALASYSSFFNFSLLESAINEIGFIEGKQLMENYKKNFAEYASRRVIKCPAGIGMKGENHTSLKVVLDNAYLKCKVEHLRTLQADICEMLEIDPQHLQVEGVEPGSICVIFHILLSVKTNVFPLTDSQIHSVKSLQYMGARIQNMMCDQYDYEIGKQQQGSITSLKLKSCEQLMNTGCSNVLDLMNKLNKPDVRKFIMEQFFIKSAKHGDLISMKKVLELSVDIDATEKDEYAWNALLYACYEGHGAIVDLLMNNGAHTDAKDVDDWTGLSLATRKGFQDIVKKLLENDADPNLRTKRFSSPLLFAAEGNYAEIAKLLIKHGAITTVCDNAAISPLTQACQLGYFEVVEALVENDKALDINKPNELGWSPLHLAVRYGYEEIVRFLVDHGADVTYKKIDGLTPLMVAASLGHYKLVKLLVEDGLADINVSEMVREWTAVFFAMRGGHLEVMKYLLNTKQVNLLHKDVDGNTLFELSENIDSTVYEYLKENHAAIN